MVAMKTFAIGKSPILVFVPEPAATAICQQTLQKGTGLETAEHSKCLPCLHMSSASSRDTL